MLRLRFSYLFALLMLCALLPAGQLAAQSFPVDLTIFRDEDSLTLYIPGNQPVSLLGIGFQVSLNDKTLTYLLEDYPAFGIPFNSVPTPVCFRLERDGSARVLPLECQNKPVLRQSLSDADIFWYDDSSNQGRTFLIVQVINALAFCAEGQARCDLTYAAPTSTPAPTEAPVAITVTTPPPVIITPTPPITYTLSILRVNHPGDLSAESVELFNAGGTVNLVGWTLRDASGSTFTFSARLLFSEGTLLIYTRVGDDTPAALFWNRNEPVWQPGDTVTLRDPDGVVQATFAVPDDNPLAEVTVTLNEDARLRAGAGVNYGIITTALAGETFPVLEQAVSQTENQVWYRVALADGDTAWVWSGVVTLTTNAGNSESSADNQAAPAYPCPATITTDRATTLNVVRREPTVDSTLRPPVSAAQQIIVADKAGQAPINLWFEIQDTTGKPLGWIPAEYVVLSQQCPD